MERIIRIHSTYSTRTHTSIDKYESDIYEHMKNASTLVIIGECKKISILYTLLMFSHNFILPRQYITLTTYITQTRKVLFTHEKIRKGIGNADFPNILSIAFATREKSMGWGTLHQQLELDTVIRWIFEGNASSSKMSLMGCQFWA